MVARIFCDFDQLCRDQEGRIPDGHKAFYNLGFVSLNLDTLVQPVVWVVPDNQMFSLHRGNTLLL